MTEAFGQTYAIWPFFASMAVLWLLAARLPLQPAVPQTKARRQTIDGLRGVLALCVVFHHAAIYHVINLTGVVDFTPSAFYNALGPFGVSVFFMITGYLFWARMIATVGRPDWLALYIGRIFRIGPLFLALCLAVLLLSLARANFHVLVPAGEMLQSGLSWLTLGLLKPGVFNGDHTIGDAPSGVTWTLHYEWLFYLSLPVLALAGRSRRRYLAGMPAALLAMLGCIALLGGWADWPLQAVLILLFLIGMGCASLEAALDHCDFGFFIQNHKNDRQNNELELDDVSIQHHQALGGSRLLARIPDWVASIVVIALVGVVFLGFANLYAPEPELLLGGAFFLVVRGCSVFGLLLSPASLNFGAISFGIYLLHGLTMATLYTWPSALRFDTASPPTHWLAAFAISVLVVLLATLAHVGIEQTGIAAGRRFTARLRLRRNDPAPVAAQLPADR